MNVENKKIWDNIFSQQPSINKDDVLTMDENGNYIPATPIGFDDEQKTYDALKEIIEGAIKNKNYKTWKVGSQLKETYGNEHLPIEEFDVIYLFTKSWEEPQFLVLVKAITDTQIEVQVLGGEDNEEILTERLSYKQ